MTCTSTCIQPSPTNAHCGACHVTFGSVSGFDRHRRAGACLNPAGLPMHRDRNGIWRFDGHAPQADAPSAVNVETQATESRSLVPRPTPAPSEAAETLSAGGA